MRPLTLRVRRARPLACLVLAPAVGCLSQHVCAQGELPKERLSEMVRRILRAM
jgi:hypothetical protein